MVSIPLMTTVVPVDRAGRIVIPKETREAQGIAPGTKFLLIEGKEGSLWLQRLDPQELARRIHEELRGIDLAPLVAKIEAEIRSEEHTSELQSQSNLVCRLLLEKKKNKKKIQQSSRDKSNSSIN